MDFHHTGTVDTAIEVLKEQSFDYLLTDLHLETETAKELPDGLRLMRAAVASQPQINILATSSDPWQAPNQR